MPSSANIHTKQAIPVAEGGRSHEDQPFGGSSSTLSLHGVDVSYGDVRAVRGVSLDVAPGEIVGLVGESGSGKSTVLRAVADLLGRSGRVTGGEMVYNGTNLLGLSHKQRARLRGSEIAYVFQDPTASLDPLAPIGRQFDECLRTHGIVERPAMRELESVLLTEMGFSDPERVLASYPHNLSGGMCQRVVLALSVALNPKLLLADEPTSSLDVTAQNQVIKLFLRIREQHGVSMLVVSHNIGAIAQMSDRIGVMYKGELVEIGPRDQVLHASQHPYTARLIAVVPRVDGSLPQVLGSDASSPRAEG